MNRLNSLLANELEKNAFIYMVGYDKKEIPTETLVSQVTLKNPPEYIKKILTNSKRNFVEHQGCIMRLKTDESEQSYEISLYATTKPILDPLENYLKKLESHNGTIISPKELYPPAPAFTRSGYNGIFYVANTQFIIAIVKDDDIKDGSAEKISLELRIIRGTGRDKDTNVPVIVTTPQIQLATITYRGTEQRYFI